MEERRSNALPILVAVVVLLAVVLSVYVGGYFLRSSLVYGPGARDRDDFNGRMYPTRWEEKIYQPAARIESFVAGRPMSIFPEQDLIFSSPQP
jgi:hypothetical protein